MKEVYSKIEEAIDGAMKETLELPCAGQVGKLLTKDDIYQLKKGCSSPCKALGRPEPPPAGA